MSKHLTKEQADQLHVAFLDCRPNARSNQEAFEQATKQIGVSIKSYSAIYRYLKKWKGSDVPSLPTSPLDQIRSAERQIAEAIRGLEAERDQLHDKIVQIDNTVAKYRNWQTNGK